MIYPGEKIIYYERASAGITLRTRSLQEATRLYNGGGDPNYLKKVDREYNAINKMIRKKNIQTKKVEQLSEVIKDQKHIIRPWVPSLNMTLSSNDGFSVMQYNILADILCNEQIFPYTFPDARNWQYRFNFCFPFLNINTPHNRKIENSPENSNVKHP